MAEIADLEAVDSANSDAPEGWQSDVVNNVQRELMAKLKRGWQSFPWIQLVQLGDVVTKNADDKVQIASVNYESAFPAGTVVRVGDGISIIIATVESVVFGAHTIITLTADSPTVMAGANVIEFLVTREALGTVALLDTGTSAGKVPIWDDFGTAAFKAEGPANTLDADLLDGVHASAIVDTRNVIANPDFELWQEGESFAAPVDQTYCADQWKLLVEQDGCVDVALTTNSTEIPDVSRSAIKVTQVTADKKWALFTLAPRDVCSYLHQRRVHYSFSAKLLSGKTSPVKLRVGVVHWDGALDDATGTPDPILTWPAAGANPVLAGSYTFHIGAGGELDLVAGTWANYRVNVNGHFVASSNWGLMIWSDDDTISIADEVYISNVVLRGSPYSLGGDLEVFVPKSMAEVRAECERFCTTTFADGVTPANYALVFEGALWAFSGAGGANDTGTGWDFPQRMFKIPAITHYSPGTVTPGGLFWWELDGGTTRTAVTLATSEQRCMIYISDNPTNDKRFAIHAKALARIF